jgi:hypothetical protein
MSALCQKQTHALQHDRRKKKDRQRGGLSEIRSGVLIGRLRWQRSFASQSQGDYGKAPSNAPGEAGTVQGRALQTDAAIKVSAPVAAVSVTPAAALDDLDGYRGALGMLA